MIALVVVVGLAGMVAWSEARRWWTGGRVLARLGPRTPTRPAPRAVARAVERAGVETDPRTLFDLWVASVLVTAAATPIVAGAPVALAAVLAGPPAALAAGRNRAGRIRVGQLPLALDAIAGSLRGGAALASAISEAASIGGPLGREFDDIGRRCRDGLDIRSALEHWAETGGSDVALAAASLTMAASVGGPAAAALESAAASLRQRAAAADEVAALSVQARLSAVVLSAAPLAFTFLLATVDPGSARFLLRTPAGWACIVVGIALDGIGGWWMHRLVRRAS